MGLGGEEVGLEVAVERRDKTSVCLVLKKRLSWFDGLASIEMDAVGV